MATAAIDMLGTFFSLEPLRQRLSSLGVPDHTLELWFAEAMRDHLANAHSGGYTPLISTLTESLPRTLTALGRMPRDRSRVEQVLKGFAVLNPTEAALRMCNHLSASGWKLLALTDGSEAHTRALLDRAGMLHRFEAVISSDVLRTSRPHPDVYAMAREFADGECWTITSHAWDAAGAKRAGLRTVWLSNKEKSWLGTSSQPDVQASGFDEALEFFGGSTSVPTLGLQQHHA
jgi:2-haloacid dehalogenase